MMKTEKKDAFIAGILYLLAAISWLRGWVCLDMRMEFLYALLMVLIIWVYYTAELFIKKWKILLKIRDKMEKSNINAGTVALAIVIFTLLGLPEFIKGSDNNAVFWIIAVLSCFMFLCIYSLMIYSLSVNSSAENSSAKNSFTINLVTLYPFIIFPPHIFFLFQFLFSNIFNIPIIFMFTFVVSNQIFRLYNENVILPLSQISRNEKDKWKYISAYPRVICKEHALRPSLIRKAFLYYDIGCRTKSCTNDYATRIVGLIGGHADNIKSDEDTFYISLWSETDKKASNADIDILEIREQEGISYDYAINAVLVTLKNDISRPSDFVKQISVVIKGNPPIPEGAMKILKNEFGELKKKHNSGKKKTG